jgi:NAD(P)-dependent dehydrogenase (short-subunit alcohol dehydrogenase family)
MAGKLGRKIALVTSRSSGIGFATANGVHDGGTVSSLMSVTIGNEKRGRENDSCRIDAQQLR